MQWLITAGPTHEAIDAVRYVANHSSGRMGIALANAARDAGCDVTLLLGPVQSEPPKGVHIERFTSTDDLQRLLETHFPLCDVLVMAAAVADYRPARQAGKKLPRGRENLVLELVPTPDLVAACAAIKQPHQRIVGFALEEPDKLDERAMRKLQRKKLDAIVANPLQTMGSESIAAKVFTPDGKVHRPPQSGAAIKDDFARWLISWIGTELRT